MRVAVAALLGVGVRLFAAAAAGAEHGKDRRLLVVS